MYLAHAGNSHAILPAFVLGFAMSRFFRENPDLQRKLRAVAFAFIMPIFFLNGGMNISLPLLRANLGVFVLLLAVKLITKGVGVLPERHHRPEPVLRSRRRSGRERDPADAARPREFPHGV